MSERKTENLFLAEAGCVLGKNSFGHVYEQGDIKNISVLDELLREAGYKHSTSIDAYVNRAEVPATKVFPKDTLYVSTNGQGSHIYAYVSGGEFVPNSDVSVLLPKRQMTLREKLFYVIFSA